MDVKEPVLPTISKPFQPFSEPTQATLAPQQAPSSNDKPTLSPQFLSQVD